MQSIAQPNVDIYCHTLVRNILKRRFPYWHWMFSQLLIETSAQSHRAYSTFTGLFILTRLKRLKAACDNAIPNEVYVSSLSPGERQATCGDTVRLFSDIVIAFATK